MASLDEAIKAWLSVPKRTRMDAMDTARIRAAQKMNAALDTESQSGSVERLFPPALRKEMPDTPTDPAELILLKGALIDRGHAIAFSALADLLEALEPTAPPAQS